MENELVIMYNFKNLNISAGMGNTLDKKTINYTKFVYSMANL